ncbi:MAG: PrgI family protein [Paenisporosarcina sp.]|nr:PrgI family protein [Paenisporosarcina sp.]
MRIEKVPVDMSSEQKEILGLLSKRQLTYLIGSGLVLYTYVPFVFKLFMGAGWLLAAIIALITAAPTVVIVLLLAFIKVEKFNMNRDYYYYIRFQRKTQYGSWRKGR